MASASENIHRTLWTIALPAMLTNIATALFGLADMWVIGRLGDAPAQGAVELGAKLLMGFLVVFNFLKTGTLALTAQAAGRHDEEAQATTLTRAVTFALALALLLFVLKPWLLSAGLRLLGTDGVGVEVIAGADRYASIRYWGIGAWLLNTALIGWLIGRRRVGSVLAVEVVANLIHIALDVIFVLSLGWGISGVALASLVSEFFKLAVLSAIVARQSPAKQAMRAARSSATWQTDALAGLFRLNRDLFIRTLLLTSVTLLLTRAGAQAGAATLAANGILFQMFMLSALLLDGFENAAQVLCGEATGARDRIRFVQQVRVLLAWGCGAGLIVSLAYLFFGHALAASFSTNAEVIATTSTYVRWAALLPLVGVISFVLDGVFIGATWTRAMMATMAVAFVVHVLVLTGARPLLGNHGVWLAYACFFVARATGQLLVMRKKLAC